jgi:hypothetical protein
MRTLARAACVPHCVGSLGATIIVPKSVLPDGDTVAILLDPAGLSFGVYRPR